MPFLTFSTRLTVWTWIREVTQRNARLTCERSTKALLSPSRLSYSEVRNRLYTSQIIAVTNTTTCLKLHILPLKGWCVVNLALNQDEGLKSSFSCCKQTVQLDLFVQLHSRLPFTVDNAKIKPEYTVFVPEIKKEIILAFAKILITCCDYTRCYPLHTAGEKAVLY